MAEDGTGSEPSDEAGAATPEPVPTDTTPDDPSTGDTDKTEHAPLAQWASRAGARSQPAGQPELQAPADPWPEPIQGLGAPADQAAVDHLETLSYVPPPLLPATAATAPEKNFSRGVIAILAVTAFVLLVGAAGLAGAVLADSEKRRENPTASGSSAAGAAARPSSSTGDVRPSPSTAVTESAEPIPSGPVAQGIAPATIFDMDEMCRGETYWPMLPARSAKKPHPVLIYGDTGGGIRLPYTMFYTWFMKPESTKTTWAPEDPTTIALMACVDRVSSGAKVRTCSYTGPNTGKAVLHRATYRVHVYETATGKKLLDTKIEAKDTSCPYVGDIPDDRKIHMELDESTLVSTLRKFVEK
ncbi:hypothetical protein [Actinoplanes flavus]|uniref:Uncharacterized protein n=1 Tax=Actinoplanes flavus TaxID=2820290 RepID=A0ABS3URZ2_9ACTN|nr:hypothetical protein [Actinoplanes flavus]MBO3741137.1 hypothetical protein [Actinoplanes flavus]